MSTRTPLALTAAVIAILALSGCGDDAAPQPEETEFAVGGSGQSGDGEGDAEGAESAGDLDPIAQATAEGLPGIPLTGCDQLDDYEYSPSVDREFWHLTFTCADRAAYDQTAAAVEASGYTPDSLVISEGDYVSERNLLTADANGGYTEVQLSIEGFDELEYEIFVTITLP
jgi:hypothetical protein